MSKVKVKDTNSIEKFQNQVWITRMSRVNAEKRLLSKEGFVQAVNIYYSCATVAMSTMLLVEEDLNYSLTTLIMTIALLIGVLYFKSLRFTERAMDFRRIYTRLQRIEFSLHNKNMGKTELSDLQSEYCRLMAEGENHISFDYYKAVMNSKGNYKKNNCTKSIKAKYRWGECWRVLIKIMVIVLPIILLAIPFFTES